MNEITPYKFAEKQPRMVDLCSSEMEINIKNNGQIYQRKIEPIHGAKQVTEAQIVETRLPDGTLESSVDAKPGAWIITGAKGEKFVFSAKKFDSLYQPDHRGGYIPRERRVAALKNPFSEAVKISAPWGTLENPAYQEGGEQCYFVISLDEAGGFTNDRYIIGDRELLFSNYDPIH